ncbi:dehydratase medium subunit [Oceanobacillus halophilus]|uniref:Dehydratase medium subunit n=1 Tax=Oceanobacillus halophilus TaxID=930130 RepID=A0A494ZT66_9BACI|nr:dehydratase medium subunit [Oceanobacillus halophilus]
MQILVSHSIGEGQIMELLYGMEEEEVPFTVQRLKEDTAIQLGYQAACSSRLGVGIGVGSDYSVILHYEKLLKEEPLFQMNILDHSLSLRALGANAARLVKGMPFKELDIKEPPIQNDRLPEKQESITKNRIASIIRRVLSEAE